MNTFVTTSRHLLEKDGIQCKIDTGPSSLRAKMLYFDLCIIVFSFFSLIFQDVLNNLGSSELDEDDLMLDLDLSDDQRPHHGMFFPNSSCSLLLLQTLQHVLWHLFLIHIHAVKSLNILL